MITDRRTLLAGATASVALTARLQATPKADRPLVGQTAATFGPRGLVSEVVAGMTRVGVEGRAVRTGELWHIGSNTKAMTAALYAVLVERGILAWNATLPSLFPANTIHSDWSNVTVEEVMGHVAGLDDSLLGGAWLRERHADTRPVQLQRAELMSRLLARPPGPTRGRYAYGNAGSIVIGAAIERATGQTWEDAMRRRLFRPLGMVRSNFGAPPRSGVWGHRGSENGPVAIDPAGLADNPQVLGPAGRVHLPMKDYGKFLALFLDHKSNLLKAETIAHLLRPPISNASYAGGWALQTSAAGRRALVHEGSNTFWHAITTLYPDDEKGFSVIANEAGDSARAKLLKSMEVAQRMAAATTAKL